jgi:hypothetical protein
MQRLTGISLLLLGCCALARADSPLVFSVDSVSFSAPAGSTLLMQRKLQLQAPGAGTSFTLSSNQGWMDVNPKGGSIPAGGSVDLTLTLDPTNLRTSDYTAVITATPTQGDVATLNVLVSVTGVTFLINPSSLSMLTYPGGDDYGKVVADSSDGTAREVAYTVWTRDGGDWLSTSAEQGLPTPLTLNITARAGALSTGTYYGEIRLASPSLPGQAPVVVPVTFAVNENAPRLRIFPPYVNFYVGGAEPPPSQPVQLYFKAFQGSQFSTSIPASATYLSVGPSSGLLPATPAIDFDTSQSVDPPHSDDVLFTPNDGTAPTRTTVQVLSTPLRVLAIPQVADGGGFRTMITIVNLDVVTATVSLRFHKANPLDHTTSDWNLAFDGQASTDDIRIPAGMSATIVSTGADAEVSSGWGEVVSMQKVTGTAVFQLRYPNGSLQEAAVPISDTLMQRLLLPYDNTGGFVTSFAVINTSVMETAKIRVGFRDNTGTLVQSDKMPDIPPQGHFAIELPNLFPYLNGKKGTMDLVAVSGHIAFLGLRFNPTGAFTSFEAKTMNSRPTGMRSLAQIADGTDPTTQAQFRTEITISNHTALTASVTLKLRRELADGSTVEWKPAFDGGFTPDSTIQIPPLSSVVLRTAGSTAGIQSGWAQLDSPFWITGQAVFQRIVPGQPDQEAAVPLNFGTPQRLLLPFDNRRPFTTSMAIANPADSSEAQVNFVIKDSAGNRVTQGTLTIPALGHRAFRLIDLFPAADGITGTLEISSYTGQISVIGLRFTDSGAFTSFKPQPLGY